MLEWDCLYHTSVLFLSLIVLASNSTTALRQLTFPAGSVVAQYPVVHVYEYYKMFGIETGLEENDTEEALPDTVLTYAEKIFDFRSR